MSGDGSRNPNGSTAAASPPEATDTGGSVVQGRTSEPTDAAAEVRSADAEPRQANDGPAGGAGPLDTDSRIVRAIQTGQRDAFEDLVRKHQHRVYNLAYRSLKDREGAEEVAQEVFVSVYRHLDRFRGGARFTSWLFRIVINQCRTRMRRRRPDETSEIRVEAPVGDDDARGVQLPSEAPDADPERTTGAREELEALSAALNELEDDQRTVLLLRDVEDLSYIEIAEILGLPEGTIKSRIHRARNQLKQQLSKYLDP